MNNPTPAQRDWLAKLGAMGSGGSTSSLTTDAGTNKISVPGGKSAPDISAIKAKGASAPGGVIVPGGPLPTLDSRSAAPGNQDDIVEIAIDPPAVTLGPGESHQFNASRDSSTNEDITTSVTWKSADATVTINSKGLATVQKGSSPSKVPIQITAFDSVSGETGYASVTIKQPVVQPPPPPKAPELQFITISEEAFGGPETSPYVGNINISQKRQFHATSDFGQDLTKKVDWSSYPEDTVSISKTGLATALKAGTASIKATLGKISNEVNLTVGEDRNPPPGPNAPLVDLQVNPNAAFEAYVNETRAFTATAIYGKEKKDWTKAVNWVAHPEDLIEIDIYGKARMKAIGKASISAHVRQPVETSHGGIKDTIANIQVTILGAPPKTKVKLPGPGRLTKPVVEALLKNLIYLSDPRLMRTDTWAGPSKPSPTGDASVDALLVLTTEVVTKWNDLNTLAEARQIWQQVQPRFAALFKEAESPKVGFKHADLNPGLDALDNISARVKSGPGTMAASHAKTHPETADFSRDAVYVKTPYGELFDSREHEKVFKQLTDPINATIPGAKKAYATLQAQLKEQAAKLKPLAPFLKSPDSAKAEILKFASNESKQDAHISRNERDIADTVKDDLDYAKKDFARAATEFATAFNDQQRKIQADALREEAKRLREKADHWFEIVGGVIESIIGMVEEAPSAVFKGAYDVITGLIKEYGDDTLNKRAIHLEEQAHELEMETFAEHIRNANQSVSDAMDKLGKVADRLAKVEKHYEQERDFAEDGFDDTCKAQGLPCKFHFADLRGALAAVQKTLDAATLSYRGWEGIVVVVGMLQKHYSQTPKVFHDRGEDPDEYNDRDGILKRNKPVTDAILKDASKYSGESTLQQNAADKLLQNLNNLRMTANVAMAEAPRRKSGR